MRKEGNIRIAVDEDTSALELLRLCLSAPKGTKMLFAAPSYAIAEQTEHELRIWAEAAGHPLSSALLPEGSWRDTVTLDCESARAELLERMNSEKPPDIVVGSVLAFLSPTPDPNEFQGSGIILRRGDAVDMARLVKRLVALGYDDEPQAASSGEFSKRGGILDVFSPGMKLPVRIEFFGNEIDSLREYTPDNGRSVREIDSCKIIARSGCEQVEGTDEYFDFSDYAPGRSLVVESPDDCAEAVKKYGGGRTAEHWEAFRKKFAPVHILESEVDCIEHGGKAERSCIGVSPALRASADEEARDSVTEISRRLSAEFVGHALEDGMEVVLAAHKDSDFEHITEWLRENGIPESDKLSVERLHIPCGVMFPKQKALFLTERELFPACLRGKDRVRTADESEEDLEKASRTELENMADIEVGDLTVHLNYGLCLYRGIKTIRSAGSAIESLELEFADEKVIYVPVWQAHLVSRYVGSHLKGAQLSKLGSSRWAKAREEAAGSAKGLACEMLRMQAIRKASPGMPFPKDGYDQKLFEDSFPYDETEGQKKAIEEIKRDMESSRPMDRLLCGDVGYGKTEVAMRAAFKCAVSGKQVAVLVPTTVLAQQHYLSFTERFAEFPIVIETLTRHKMGKERKQIVERLADGSIDIIIGTHALVGSEVKFHELGLVIIDEEQRFGVEHKEKLKAVRSTVDVLTMTATPIPRTLHMSMSGLRDLSAITTAPTRRLPVHTVVAQQEKSLVSAALARELGRGGQVFYIHNRVNSIEKTAEEIRSLAPGARVAVAHGQMRGSELEGIMGLFIEGKIDVLVCTTIIESGIDIPNANTMIIERADMFGLAELHQLRGRVGRWNRQAYAYLLLPPSGIMTGDARRRMQAIRRYTHLGSGFQLAIRDLEIRGAGNIIGAEQSGHVDAIGFHLYCQLLREAANNLRGIKNARPITCDLNLDFLEYALDTDKKHLAAAIPPDYIEDDRLRLEAYRRLAMFEDPAQVDDYHEELRDKYGPLPDAAENMLTTVRLRLLGAACGFHAVSCRDGKIYLEQGNSLYRPGGMIPKLNADWSPKKKLTSLLGLLECTAAQFKAKREQGLKAFGAQFGK